jgi:hypothetical protein
VLRERGLEDPAASLTGEVAIAVFRIAFERWLVEGAEQDFPTLIRESLVQLKGLLGGGPAPADATEPSALAAARP